MKKVSEENGETTKKHVGTLSPAHVSAPEHELKRLEKHHQNLRGSTVRLVGASHKKARLLSNNTHYNPHDPDARISVKPGKARKLNYHCSMPVDTAEGVISQIQADFADGRDSQYQTNISLRVQNRLRKNELIMPDLLTDKVIPMAPTTIFPNKGRLPDGYPFSGNTNPR